MFRLDSDGTILSSVGSVQNAPSPEPGESVFDLYEGKSDAIEHIGRALTGETFTATVSLWGEGGQEVVLETTYIPSLSFEGHVTQVVGVTLDVTRRTHALEDQRRALHRLRALTDQLHAERERERCRIARNVHDVLGQTLTAFRFDIQWLRRQITNGQEVDVGAVGRRLDELNGSVDDAIVSVQRIASDLRPPDLDLLGLVGALRGAAGEFGSRTGVKCDFRSDLDPDVARGIDPDRSTAVYRIAQEALTNVCRHAEADHVSVRLFIENGTRLAIEVDDDGRGMDTADLRVCIGLSGMDERARRWGGEATIRSRPGGGTRVRAVIPLSDGTTRGTE